MTDSKVHNHTMYGTQTKAAASCNVTLRCIRTIYIGGQWNKGERPMKCSGSRTFEALVRMKEGIGQAEG